MVGRRTRRIVFATLICVLWAAAALADEQLPPVDVKATLSEADALTSPVASVITPDDQVPAGQISGLTDLLKLTNSIYIQDSTYGKQLYFRGMTDQDLRVLINGAPIGQLGKYYALAYGWQTIPLENIERIEVIRGAGSVEYGNTLVGTINIITKKGGKDIRSTASVNYGTFNDFKADATNSGSVGKFNWAVGGGYRHRDEYLNNNDIDQYNVSGSVGVDMAEAGNLQLTGFASKKDEGFALDDRVNWTVWSDANDLANGSEYHLETNTAIASYTSSWFDATASYTQQKRDDDYRKDSWASGDTYDYTIDYRTPSVSAKLHHTFGKHSLKFGGEYTYGDAKAEWTYYGDPVIEKLHFQQDLAGLYAEDSWQVLEKLNFTLGVRYDYFKNKLTTEGADPNTDTEIDDDGFSPRASLTYDLPSNWQAFAYAGHVFKAPTMGDLYRWYGSYELISFAGRAVLRAYYGLQQPAGAPKSLIPQQYIDSWQSMIGQLKPAKGWDYELGVRRMGKDHAIQVNLFYQDIDDYINVYPVSYPPTYNVDNVKIYGVELTGVYTYNRYLEIEAIYTLMGNKVENDKIIQKIYGKDELFNAPDQVLNLTLRSRPLDDLLIEWQTQFISSRFAGGAPGVPPQVASANPKYEPMYELDPYWLHNIRASYTVHMGGTDVTFSAAVENIFDEDCYVRLDYPLPGTLIYGGVKFAF